MESEELVWEDPPDGNSGGHRKWESLLAPVRAIPGKWARLGPYAKDRAYNVASRISGGKMAGIKSGDFEARACTLEDGNRYVYVRYIGVPKTYDDPVRGEGDAHQG